VKLYFGKLAPSAIAATTAAAGFPAINLASEQLGKPWNATGLGATDITVTLPALSTVMLVAIHDVNFATCNVQKSVDGVAWVNVGALNTYRDRHGRRRGSLLVNAAGQLASSCRSPPAWPRMAWRPGAPARLRLHQPRQRVGGAGVRLHPADEAAARHHAIPQWVHRHGEDWAERRSRGIELRPPPVQRIGRRPGREGFGWDVLGGSAAAQLS
jgi:hypothetical protein